MVADVVVDNDLHLSTFLIRVSSREPRHAVCLSVNGLFRAALSAIEIDGANTAHEAIDELVKMGSYAHFVYAFGQRGCR